MLKLRWPTEATPSCLILLLCGSLGWVRREDTTACSAQRTLPGQGQTWRNASFHGWPINVPVQLHGWTLAHKFEAQPNDIIIANNGRAGLHAISVAVAEVVERGNATFVLTEDFFAFETPNTRHCLYCEFPTSTAPSSLSRRIIYTHIPFQMQAPVSSQAKYIATVRDPVDAGESMFRIMSARNGPGDLTASQWVINYMVVSNPSWAEWNAGAWHLAQQRPDIAIVIQYEDFVDDPTATIKKLASFLGVSMSDAQVTSAVFRSSVQYELTHHRHGVVRPPKEKYAKADFSERKCGNVRFISQNHTHLLNESERTYVRTQLRRRLETLGAAGVWPRKHRSDASTRRS